MIRTVKPRKGNQRQVAYEEAFAAKFKLVEDLPNYDVLEAFAQRCIDNHCGDSFAGIEARVYMDKILEMSDENFIHWASCLRKSEQ